jgi:hypothetical protein
VSSLTFGGVTGRNNQSPALLINKEYDQISASVSLADSSVQILPWNYALFRELKPRSVHEQFLNFILTHTMLALDLISELSKPNNFVDSH